MNILLRELQQNEAVASILQGKSELGNVSLSEEALLLAEAYRLEPKSMFVVKNNTYNAQKLYDRLETLLGNDVILLNVEESLRVEAIASSPENKAAQMETMAKLLEEHPYVCILNTAAAIHFQPTLDTCV